MGVGKSIIVDLPADAGEIFVGNPAIANAVVRSARKIYIIGQATGQTTIYAMDKQGRRIATLELSIGRDIGEMQAIIRAALPKSKIIARTVNDSIILTGEVDSAAEMQSAMDIAKGFVDSVNNSAVAAAPRRPPPASVVNAITVRGRDQVMIKVTIAEIQRNIAKQLGISASTLAGNWGTFTQQIPSRSTAAALTDGALKTVTKFGGALVADPDADRFRAQRRRAHPRRANRHRDVGRKREVHRRRRSADLRAARPAPAPARPASCAASRDLQDCMASR